MASQSLVKGKHRAIVRDQEVLASGHRHPANARKARKSSSDATKSGFSSSPQDHGLRSTSSSSSSSKRQQNLPPPASDSEAELDDLELEHESEDEFEQYRNEAAPSYAQYQGDSDLDEAAGDDSEDDQSGVSGSYAGSMQEEMEEGHDYLDDVQAGMSFLLCFHR